MLKAQVVSQFFADRDELRWVSVICSTIHLVLIFNHFPKIFQLSLILNRHRKYRSFLQHRGWMLVWCRLAFNWLLNHLFGIFLEVLVLSCNSKSSSRHVFILLNQNVCLHFALLFFLINLSFRVMIILQGVLIIFFFCKLGWFKRKFVIILFFLKYFQSFFRKNQISLFGILRLNHFETLILNFFTTFNLRGLERSKWFFN